MSDGCHKHAGSNAGALQCKTQTSTASLDAGPAPLSHLPLSLLLRPSCVDAPASEAAVLRSREDMAATRCTPSRSWQALRQAASNTAHSQLAALSARAAAPAPALALALAAAAAVAVAEAEVKPEAEPGADMGATARAAGKAASEGGSTWEILPAACAAALLRTAARSAARRVARLRASRAQGMAGGGGWGGRGRRNWMHDDGRGSPRSIQHQQRETVRSERGWAFSGATMQEYK